MKIKSENILKVIRNFEKVMEMYPHGRLDMGCTRVNSGNICGTVHCHAGWYALVAENVRKGEKIITFSGGAVMMAHDLGVRPTIPYCLADSMELCNWAHDNPELWGNNGGMSMFGSETAFISESRPEGAKNLQHIIDHWKEVYERVKVTEVPEYQDITKKLAVLPQDEVADTKVKELV